MFTVLMAFRGMAFAACFMFCLVVQESRAAGAAESSPETSPQVNVALQKVLQSEHRAESSARDRYRHPGATLEFFGIQPAQTVIEIWPGGKGWYTEVLAPYLREQGKLYAAHFNEDSSSAFFRQSRLEFIEKMQAQPTLYDAVEVTTFNPPKYLNIAPPESADAVLTFRNVHNWYMAGRDENVLAAFKGFHQALKPGGVLGVVDHRLPEARPIEEMASSGYLKESYIIRLAELAGFELVGKSEINSNEADTASHPEGVWSLPPTLRGGGKNRDAYLKIGESDRMTLKFIKPMK